MTVETLGLTAERCAQLLDQGELSCRELVDAYLERIEAHDGDLHCFLRVRAEAARAEADRLDREGRSGRCTTPAPSAAAATPA
jgi:aspartyl-tRNA(Asn)/glutamyl-tRNA(Gln) amidotransferase subunit A